MRDNLSNVPTWRDDSCSKQLVDSSKTYRMSDAYVMFGNEKILLVLRA
jgi:hypothetical protein